MSDSYYDVAQICMNGHVVTSMLRDFPAHSQKHCERCGAATISACGECGAPIRGFYHVPGTFGHYDYDRPSFCVSCGAAYPWTSAALSAARDLASEEEAVPAEERARLVDSLPDLIADTPNTQVAVARYKKFMMKASAATAGAMRDVFVDVVSEAVKKALFPGP